MIKKKVKNKEEVYSKDFFQDFLKLLKIIRLIKHIKYYIGIRYYTLTRLRTY